MTCRSLRTHAVVGVVASLAAATLLASGCTGSDVAGVGPRVRATDSAATTAAERGPSLGGKELAALRRKADLAPCSDLLEPAGSPAAATASPRPVARGSRPPRLPDVTLPCLGADGDLRLTDLSGRPAVVNVWAQWCAPCRTEAPHFQALYERAGDDLLVLGVDYDDPRPDRALALAHELGLRYPQVADPDKLLKAPFGLLTGIPATVFVDGAGRVVHISHRAYASEKALRADVRTHLGIGT